METKYSPYGINSYGDTKYSKNVNLIKGDFRHYNDWFGSLDDIVSHKMETGYLDLEKNETENKQISFNEKRSFEGEDINCYNRKTAFYNKGENIAEHYIRSFSQQLNPDWVQEEIYKIDNFYNVYDKKRSNSEDFYESGIDVGIDMSYSNEKKLKNKSSSNLAKTKFLLDETDFEDGEEKEIKPHSKQSSMKETKDASPFSNTNTTSITFGSPLNTDNETHKHKEKKKDKKKKDKTKDVIEATPTDSSTTVQDKKVKKPSKVVDKLSTMYISSDKTFLITGTTTGFVHIWSFLQPYQSSHSNMMDGLGLLERQKQRRPSFNVVDGEEEAFRREMDYSGQPNLRRLEVLGWSDLYSKPNLSFKAHDSSITSVQITPKTFSNGNLEYVLVTTSLDKKMKVWRVPKLNNNNEENIDKDNTKENKEEKESSSTSSEGSKSKRNKKLKIKLIGCLEDKEAGFVDAVFVPSTSNQIIVARGDGTVEKFEILHFSSDLKEEKAESNLLNIARTRADENLIIGSISTGCNYYAVGGENGLVNIYDVSSLMLLSSFTCRNKKGFNKVGKQVTGIEWNKKDDLILVTTLDSRIRLLSFKIPNENQGYGSRSGDKVLEYVEKFKGHTNKKKKLKARFFGMNEQCVICPSESGQLMIWLISEHIENQGYGDNEENENKEIKNHDSFAFKVENKNLLDSVNIINALEWEKLLEAIAKSKEKELRDADQLGGCLAFRKKIKNENANPGSDLLLISSPNGSQLKYSLIDTRYFE